MALKLNTEIIINAAPEKVWGILTDFKRYPEWNPFIKSISGDVKTGNKIEVQLEPPGSSGMTFKPMVLAFEAERELRWIGHLLFKGLFDGEHQFTLTENKNGSVCFTQNEIFTGILVPLFRKMIDHNTKNGFQLMNQKIKQLSESE